MAKYANRIKRRLFVKGVKRRLMRMMSLPSSDTMNSMTIDDTIWNYIKETLDYTLEYSGFYNTNIRYTMHKGDKYSPSLIEEYTNYFGKTPTDKELQRLFDNLTSKLLPLYIDRYVDLELLTGENEFGKYFEIKFNN